MWRREGKVDKETEEEEQWGKLNQRERERKWMWNGDLAAEIKGRSAKRKRGERKCKGGKVAVICK